MQVNIYDTSTLEQLFKCGSEMKERSMKMSKEQMPETMYRASRCCRILGNPTAYLIIRFMGQGRKTPTEISRDLHISLPVVSATLRQLRNLDLVRYQTQGKTKLYWVKDRASLDILVAIETWVRSIRIKQY